MKFKFMSSLAALTLLVSCGTTTTTTTTSTSNNAAFEIPATVSTSFTTLYPNATVATWRVYDVNADPLVDWDLVGWTPPDAGDYTVIFSMDGQTYHGWFNDQGTWIGSAHAITDFTKLPAAVNSSITNQFAGYTIEGVQREYWKDNSAYEIKLNKGDEKVKLLMDAEGKVLKQKSKS